MAYENYMLFQCSYSCSLKNKCTKLQNSWRHEFMPQTMTNGNSTEEVLTIMLMRTFCMKMADGM